MQNYRSSHPTGPATVDLRCGIVFISKLLINFKPNSLLCNPSFRSTVSVFCNATLGVPPTTFNNEQHASKNPGYSAAESITDLRSCSLFGLNVATLKHLCNMRNHPKLVLAVDSSSLANRSLGEFFENTVVPSTDICVNPMFVLSFGLSKTKNPKMQLESFVNFQTKTYRYKRKTMLVATSGCGSRNRM